MEPDVVDFAEKSRDNLFRAGCGGDVLDALCDPMVCEISLNDDGTLWVERHGEPMRLVGRMTPDQAMSLIAVIGDAAGQIVDAEHPVLEAELPQYHVRFEGVIPPLTRAPAFSLRIHSSRMIPLEEYVAAGVMPASVHDIIRESVDLRRNILVIGGTGSGKTTLLNGILHEIGRISPQDRHVFFEDTRELRAPEGSNSLFLKSSLHVPMRNLLKTAMRLRPDRIHVGEVRDGAALDLLMSWNTGHPGGISTLHANSAAEGLDRMEQMISMVSKSPMQKLIGSAVDLLVFIRKDGKSRKIIEVLRCHGYDPKARKYTLETVYAA